VLNAAVMTTKSPRFATAMSRFALITAIAGCMQLESSGIDSSPPVGPPTSLAGPIPCGSMQCPSGTLCTHWTSGIDAGVPDSQSCGIVPAQCRVYDCTTNCAECIYELCSSAGYYHRVNLVGRDLYCPGI
jgi:hypothetical protein